MIMRQIVILSSCILMTLKALAWGPEGHRWVARIAMDQVSPETKAKVLAILEDKTPEMAATWPDDIKGAAGKIGEGKDFISRFGDHKKWHYVNLPLGATSAELQTPRFAHRGNIVDKISLCSDVLEGRSAVMSKKHALCWLFHLMGDLSQPLHVACGYYVRGAERGEIVIITDPDSSLTVAHDHGGNDVEFTQSMNLHKFWDNDMVKALGTAVRRTGDLGQTLSAASRGRKPSIRFVNVNSFLNDQVDSSISAARKIYEGVTVKSGVLPGPLAADWTEGRSTYVAQHLDLVQSQLVQGAASLAVLLEHLKL